MESSEILALIITGLIAGTAAASLLSRGKRTKGTDWIVNTVVGILGALVGGLLFDLLGLDDDLPDILRGEITVAGVIIAFFGALIVIAISRLVNRR
jgi:uncharacterized membrane protein YeaQ/YmgE (transglycosylase-associated protein family)